LCVYPVMGSPIYYNHFDATVSLMGTNVESQATVPAVRRGSFAKVLNLLLMEVGC
jgi:hypothetical protein